MQIGKQHIAFATIVTSKYQTETVLKTSFSYIKSSF
jgi:uncharacterized protein YlxP (DUF503 family)